MGIAAVGLMDDVKRNNLAVVVAAAVAASRQFHLLTGLHKRRAFASDCRATKVVVFVTIFRNSIAVQLILVL